MLFKEKNGRRSYSIQGIPLIRVMRPLVAFYVLLMVATDVGGKTASHFSLGQLRIWSI